MNKPRLFQIVSDDGTNVTISEERLKDITAVLLRQADVLINADKFEPYMECMEAATIIAEALGTTLDSIRARQTI